MTDKPTCTWGNHCLCEWCCPNRIENMFCICARNFDDVIETCDHDTRIILSSALKAEREKMLKELKDTCTQIDDNDQYYMWLEDVESVLLRGEP